MASAPCPHASFCDEDFAEGSPAKVSDHRVSMPGRDIRTPYFLRMLRTNFRFEISNLRFAQHARPRPSPSPDATPIGFAPAFVRKVWVWFDTLPQRNCGRFSRPSPLPGQKLTKNNEPLVNVLPTDGIINAQICATVGKLTAFPIATNKLAVDNPLLKERAHQPGG